MYDVNINGMYLDILDQGICQVYTKYIQDSDGNVARDELSRRPPGIC